MCVRVMYCMFERVCVCKTEKENQGCIKEDLDEHLRLDSISSYESCSMLHETKN